ncbi:MAG: response regulator transcription factor [Bacteroidales bacterium]|jgi:DNA-binding response OmpR family regulator|nr:response regulator transcription factor [Bacteroidales bacterium]
MIKKRILVVDDEEDLCEILKFNLEQESFAVDIALSAEEALRLDIPSFDLILLDVMMGEISGFKMAEILRNQRIEIPIIFCSAKDEEEDTLTGLEIGGDDYILKPFSVKEVIARVKAVLRRFSTTGLQDKETEIIKFEGITINIGRKKATINGSDIDLTKTEYQLLTLFIQNQEKIFSREELLVQVRQADVFVTERTIDVHITRLRKKIIPYDKYINSRSGFGYFFGKK